MYVFLSRRYRKINIQRIKYSKIINNGVRGFEIRINKEKKYKCAKIELKKN